MRPALFLIPLFLLSACGPSEKPADVATAAEVEAASQLPQVTYVDSSEKAGSCRLEIGDEEAHKLAQRCVRLSPETKQLCDVDTSCKIIRTEIKRACDNLPINLQLPAECG
ncbi:hypothetical protein ABAC460_11320 [Asticcacaulis sp. AC460]|uniref:hypothetical protein n=1 Tax=Asticcacaulis sp. AC460 TaxID=1282360 RepID=UPI0003C3C292|nr:hypothetical protein [Asticcacaulis sp. AC460]ESQ89884.1 hypothetical protein ABAC460_11320 [Asticcacaulis sp. AC460]